MRAQMCLPFRRPTEHRASSSATHCYGKAGAIGTRFLSSIGLIRPVGLES